MTDPREGEYSQAQNIESMLGAVAALHHLFLSVEECPGVSAAAVNDQCATGIMHFLHTIMHHSYEYCKYNRNTMYHC